MDFLLPFPSHTLITHRVLFILGETLSTSPHCQCTTNVYSLFPLHPYIFHFELLSANYRFDSKIVVSVVSVIVLSL